jgi:hypothetical protein
MKKLRGRWNPTSEQISVLIDCAAARMPITRAAELVGIAPRALWLFVRRIGLPGLFGAWKDRPRYKPISSASGGSRTAETEAGPSEIDIPISSPSGHPMTPHKRLTTHGASLAHGTKRKRWRARAYIGGRDVHLGYFASQEEARAAHAAAVKAHLGEKYLIAGPGPLRVRAKP